MALSRYVECEDRSPDLTTIYLQPRCACDPYGEGRVWCEDPQDPCENCGAKWIKFTRARQKRGPPLTVAEHSAKQRTKPGYREKDNLRRSRSKYRARYGDQGDTIMALQEEIDKLNAVDRKAAKVAQDRLNQFKKHSMVKA